VAVAFGLFVELTKRPTELYSIADMAPAASP
jgi:hypothetical protein